METIAACYIRVSTEDQTEYSPAAQKRALEHYASQHGMTLAPEHIYVDAGISGRRAVTRPAFMTMIAAAKEKPPPFSVILVHKFDRFARNREDSIVYKSMLRRQCGVQVVSITEHLEDDRMGLILEAMLEAMAEYYSLNLGEEVRKGMTEKARRGEFQTAPPFGYRVSDHRLVPVPQEGQAVREIFRRFLNGDSMAKIARWTRETGILTHRGNPLDARRVKYILENPVYVGELRWCPAQGEALIVPGGHPPIVEPETFETAQNLLRANAVRFGRYARPAEDRKHWLAGLVRCGACGRKLIFSRPHYMKCGGYVKGKCTTSQHVPVRLLEEALLAQLRRDAVCESHFDVQVFPSKEETSAQRELANLERKLSRLREAFLCGAETAEEYKAHKESLSALADDLRRKMEQQEDPLSPLEDRLRQSLASLEYPQATLEAKHRAASAVLENCLWDRENSLLTICYDYETSPRN
ncbi:MAG: recombinase family protein [Ruminiclostridium sp.]|nr:recombinase family protein [Ruminiclostridium sp.]